MKVSWNEKTLSMKLLHIVGFIVAGAILILVALQLLGILENADNVYMPGLSVLMFIQAAENWKINKPIALMSLLSGLFILAVVAVHFIKF